MTDHLTPHQKRMLMELLVTLAKADGVVEQLESEVIEDYAELLDVGLEEVGGGFSVADLAPHFDTPMSRVTAIQELCRLARLDGNFAKLERDTILDVGRHFGFSPEFVGEIDAWVVEGMRWVAHGDTLVERAGGGNA
jgi:uncharacterized tellurite resistance protein B-like protein